MLCLLLINEMVKYVICGVWDGTKRFFKLMNVSLSLCAEYGYFLGISACVCDELGKCAGTAKRCLWFHAENPQVQRFS